MSCYICGRETNNGICSNCGQLEQARQPWHLAVGLMLNDRYVVGPSIGYGGFGVTYVAYDQLLLQKVAIKEYLPGELATRLPGEMTISIYEGAKTKMYHQGLENFIEEARVLANYNEYPGIVSVLDYFDHNKTAYLVMEFIEGTSLKKYLNNQEGGRVDFDEMLRIIMPVLDALKAIHKDQLIHRDISPDNIMMTESGDVKLIDFGAARYASSIATKSLSVILKPGYAPEEQYRSTGKQGPWSDLYAVSATIYRMITGMVPTESLERTIHDDLVLPSEVEVKMPGTSEIALMNGLAVRAQNRYQSIDEFITYITGVKIAQPINNDSKIARRKKRKKYLRIVAIISFFITIGLVAFYMFFVVSNSEQQVTSISKEQDYMPDLVGLSIHEGRVVLADKGLEILIVDKISNEHIERDLIVEQSINSGEIIGQETVVEVAISAGSSSVFDINKMPDLEYKSIKEAKEILAEYEIIPIIHYVVSEEVQQGNIVGQNHEPGKSLQQCETIILDASSESAVAVVYENKNFYGYIKNTIVGKGFDEDLLVDDLKAIEILNLSKSELSYIDIIIENEMNAIEYMSGVKRLDITGVMATESLIKYVNNLNSLEELTIDFTPDFPFEQLSSQSLKILSIKGNQLEDLSFLKSLPNLEVVDLSFNYDLKLNSICNPQIKSLNISHCDLESITIEENLYQLETLTAEYNGTKKISGLEYMQTLSHLSLRGNLFASVQDFSICNELIYLDLRENFINTNQSTENLAEACIVVTSTMVDETEESALQLTVDLGGLFEKE